MSFDDRDLQYLDLLAKQYPTIQAASTEIINLNAILNLPKGTEHFVSDIHGEYEAFLHVLRNGSGSIKRRIDEIFAGTLLSEDRRNLATLVYYPERKMSMLVEDMAEQEKAEWYQITLFRLVKVCRVLSSKYTRSKVRKALPKDFAYVIEELLHEQEEDANKQAYYESIIKTIIAMGRASNFIIALCNLIQRLAIDHLHVIGDIYDRGPGAHIIMDELMAYHSVDIQWGNHDILWMGAAAGGAASMANVIRISLRYANMETLEDGYGISMLPLATFALNVYGDDPCTNFIPKNLDGQTLTEHEISLMAKMHKAIAIIQFKLEGQIIQRRPHYQMDNRLLLHQINQETGMVCIDGEHYPLNDKNFPTVDPQNAYCLTEEEQNAVRKLLLSFKHSDKLQEHVRFLYAKGSMYLIYNGNLLYHGSIAMSENGEFREFTLDGKTHGPKEYMDRVERLARQGYFATLGTAQKEYGLDAMWFLWTGHRSPLFGKDKMTTFERYFVDDQSTHTENKNPYFALRNEEETADKILREFGLDPEASHIVNGHVPVKVKKGESPIKANGKMLVIDGGFAKAYQQQTGIAGYTLVYNSWGLLLAAHQTFHSTEEAIANNVDMHSKTQILETKNKRTFIRDTDLGVQIGQQIDALLHLVEAYREGYIKER